MNTYIKHSVCLTTFNGEKYIAEQVSSILPQLNERDELIICDDASCDSTIEIIQSFQDSRIKLYKNATNLGHVKNFEKAISLSSGNYIFFSDQDDIWASNKISKIMNAFNLDQDIVLVHHGLVLIDESGTNLLDQPFQFDSKIKNSFLFLIRNLFKPQVFGCACAINASKLKNLMPFPSCVYAHDHWIALWSALNGKVYFLGDALVHYRQHAYNLTPKKTLPAISIMRNRMRLFAQLFILLFRRLS